MTAWAERLSTLGRVHTFDYPYFREGRRAPDRQPVLIAAHREALHAARAEHRGPVFLVGKSMGGRIGCHVSLEETVDGLICLGYPLKAPGPRGALRDAVLVALKTRILFVQGTRDPLCPLETLAPIRQKMHAPNDLHVVAGGDHSLVVGVRELARRSLGQEDVDRETLAAVAAFVGA
jgi:predicted alpha/beta-hydrolase family hydrolase